MSAELLARVASIRAVATSEGEKRVQLVHLEAALECAEHLTLSGQGLVAIDLVDSILPFVPQTAERYRIRLEIQAVRALYLVFWDSECHERSARSIRALQH